MHDAARLFDVTRGRGRPGRSVPARTGSGAHGASSRAVLTALSCARACADSTWVRSCSARAALLHPLTVKCCAIYRSSPVSLASAPARRLSASAPGVSGICERRSRSLPSHASRCARQSAPDRRQDPPDAAEDRRRVAYASRSSAS